MNLILLDAVESARGSLPADDARSQHIRRVLRAGVGARLKAGVVGGPIGIVELLKWDDEGWRFVFSPLGPAPPPLPLTVLLAVCRPPVMRRLLRDLASFGCEQVVLFPANLGEGDYSRSHLWRQVPELLREGAQQGGQTHLPCWRLVSDVSAAMDQVPRPGLWCDCVAGPPLLRHRVEWPAAVAVGPERGWSEGERRLAVRRGWHGVSLGTAILRCELAVQLAAGVLRQRWEIE